MSRQPKAIIEFRDYHLPAGFPVLLLTGEHWRISDIPSDRLHIHNCLEIGLCETDRGMIKFEDTACPFEAGDVTAISCDIPHTTWSEAGTASKWSYLFVDIGELLQPFFSRTDLENSQLFSISDQGLNLILKKAQYPDIYFLVTRIIKELKEQKASYQLSVRGLFLDLAIQLIRTARSMPKAENQYPENAIVIAPALDYIRRRYMEDFSMDYLASLCCLSPTHFRRLFSSVMKTSPLEYLNRTRLRKAADLLRMTEASVLSISEQVGFHSISSFNRHFLAVMGQTPGAWRRQMSVLKNQSVFKYNGWMYAEAPKRKAPMP